MLRKAIEIEDFSALSDLMCVQHVEISNDETCLLKFLVLYFKKIELLQSFKTEDSASKLSLRWAINKISITYFNLLLQDGVHRMEFQDGVHQNCTYAATYLGID